MNQKSIAEKLDLSIATVSRSLRGHPDVKSQTRKRVIELASRLGYHSMGDHGKSKGDNLGTEKLVSVGVLVCWSRDIKSDPNVAANHMLAGISAEADKLNISLATHFVSPERCRGIAEPENQFPAMRAGMLSGMLLIYSFPHEIVRDFVTLMPCVSLVHPYTDLGVDCIDNDHAAGIEMVVDHLYHLGHRRIGFLGTFVHSSWFFSRFTGYMRALGKLGLPCDFSIVFNVSESILDNEAYADAILEQSNKGVTAWVCADDYVGYSLYPRLTARGLRIPQDISLVGFSGLGPRREGQPRMTSVHPPYEQMGAAALRRLLNRIKRPDGPARHVQFGCEFVEGQTTAPLAEQ